MQHRANDGGLLRLLGKWLKAGVMEHGVVSRATDGTPQGGPVSPVLANIYLHYVLDLWFERRFRRSCRGHAELTRYGDDFVAVFEEHAEAERFRREVEERLEAFGLKVAPEKTALLRFDGELLKGAGRPAERSATFTFLGFVHFWTKTRWGQVTVGRTPSVRSRERFLRRTAEWLRAHRHLWVREQQAYLVTALQGYYRYFGLRLCGTKLGGVRQRVRRHWQRALQRRSQRGKRRCDWTTLDAQAWFQLPQPRLTATWV